MILQKSFEDWLWEKTGLSFWEDWSNLFSPKKYNWVNFNFIHLYVEWDKADNSFDLELGLLGLNMRWQIALPGTTRQKEELKKRLEEFEKGVKGKEVKKT